MEKNKREHYVYKYTYYGTIIYIGQTINLFNRHNQHMNEEQFLTLDRNELKLYYFKVNHSSEMNIWETILINKYRPIYNKKSKFKDFDQRLLSFEEPTWHIYGLGSKSDLIEETLREEMSKNKEIIISNQDINLFCRTRKVLKLITFDKLPKDITKPELDRILYLTFDEEKVKLNLLEGLHANIVEDEDNYYVTVIKNNNPDFKSICCNELVKIFEKTDNGVWMNVIDKSLIKGDNNKKDSPLKLKNILPTKKDIRQR